MKKSDFKNPCGSGKKYKQCCSAEADKAQLAQCHCSEKYTQSKRGRAPQAAPAAVRYNREHNGQLIP